MKPCADACGRFRKPKCSYCYTCQSARTKRYYDAHKRPATGTPWSAWRPGWLSQADDPNRKSAK